MSARGQEAPVPLDSLRWIRLARAGWYGCALVTLGIFVLSVPANLLTAKRYLQSSVTVTGSPLWPQVLSIVGFLSFAAAALFSLILAVVLFWRRPNDRMALFLAYFLLVYGTVEAGPLASLEAFWPGLQAFTWTVIQPLLFAPLLVAFLSIFPNGRFEPSWTRRLVALTSISHTTRYVFIVIFSCLGSSI